MLEQLGRDLAKEFEDIDFIGLFHGETISVCTFNCNRTGATFCGNNFKDIEERLKNIRETFTPINSK